MLEHINLPSYQLAIRVVAISKYGDPYSGTSNNLIVSISKGCGTYVRVTEGYTQPVMKRAVAFAKVSNTMILASAEDYALTDENGLNFYAKTGKASDWSLMQEFYTKKNNEWKTSDIRYEVLTDKNGEIITDSNNEPIYTL
jgi:hypothetical protein